MQDLRQEFKNQTGMRCVVEDGRGNSLYSKEYVEWLEERQKLIDSSIMKPGVEELVRYTIKKWSSLSGQEQGDYQELVEQWIAGDLKNWLKDNSKIFLMY